MQIFNDNPSSFAAFFGLDRSELPDPDTCRALVVSGSIQSGDTETLIEHLRRSKGWLATVYLSFNGIDRSETPKFSQVIRGFWLKTRVLRTAPFLYEPDFISARAAEVGGAENPSVEGGVSPRGLRAFSARHDLSVGIDPCRNVCDGDCTLLWASGVNRLAEATGPVLDAGWRGEVVAGDPTIGASGGQRQNTSAPPKAATAVLPQIPEWVENDLQRACAAELSAARGLETRLGADIESLARAASRNMQLDHVAEEIRSMRAAGERVQRCVASVYERSRLASFTRLCGASCDQKTVLANLDSPHSIPGEITRSDVIVESSKTTTVSSSSIAPTRLVYRGASNDNTGEFARMSDGQWVETTVQKVAIKFCAVAESNAGIVLYDGRRGAYVRANIAQKKLFYLGAGEQTWRALYDIVEVSR